MDMDCYSIDSEILGTIDYLRPPVNRDNVNTQSDYLGYLIGASDDEKFVKDFTKIYKTERKKNSQLHTQCVETSASLILQKTCRHEIIERYSSVNSKNRFIRNKRPDEKNSSAVKPIIDVTIVPKTEQQPLINLLKKHRITKSLKETAAANSYQTNNLYLVVAGNAGEKIYEVKTKGSATFSCKTLNDIVKVKHVKKSNNNKTQQIRFHKMERKKKKQAKVIRKEEAECSNANNCACKFCANDLEHNRINRGSSVKIFGRIERDEDEKYFLNCKATINGQPVSTNCNEAAKRTLCDVSTNSSANKNKNQSTQVDLTVKLITPCQTIDQNIQCNCNDNKNTSKDVMSAEEPQMNNLKASNSPIVIISVYPTHDSSFGVKATPDIGFPNELNMQSGRALRSNRKENNKVNTFIINTDLHNTRPPSPKRVNLLNVQSSDSNKKENNKINKALTTKPNRASRSASPTNRAPKLKIQDVKKQSFVESNVIKNHGRDNDVKIGARDESPYRNFVQDKKSPRDTNVSKQNKSVNLTSGIETQKQRKSNIRSYSTTCDKSVNTDKIKFNDDLAQKDTKTANKNRKKSAKKSIVVASDALKDKQPILKKFDPKHETSKVSVNIDSEKECYDVIFEKGKFSTDLTVRKMIKENGAQKYFVENFEDNLEETFRDEYSDENQDSGSLANFFPVQTSGQHRRSVSQAFNGVLDGYPITEHVSRLAVRDSLEISHRRDAKDVHIQSSKRLFVQNYGEEIDGDFLAPIKHFTGDDCMSFDPVERDKEIRELLGIEKIRSDKKQTYNSRHKIFINHHRISTHHLFQGALCKSLLTSLMLRKACSCPFCTGRISMAGEVNSFNSLRKEEENTSIDEKKPDLNIITGPKRTGQIKEEARLYDKRTCSVPVTISESIQCEAVEESHLNHNQRKQKAIYLSRKQYIKVKKSIRKCQRQKGKQIWNSSIVSIGNIRAKTKSEYLMHWNQEVQTDEFSMYNGNRKKNKRHKKKEPEESQERKCSQRNAFEPTCADNNYNQKDTVVLYCRDRNTDNLHGDTKNTKVRKIASSVEIRYSNGGYVKEMAYSFMNFESLGSSKLERKQNKSIETIFRCHGKTHTPNLGASALSLLSEDGRSVSKSESLPLESRPKKPFLRRLMSCLVMRSARTSDVKIAQRKPQSPTMPSSFDSYHISTSLGAVEMGSSVYDTSVSFYSNHTIGPLTNKTKRGFLNSVRGFLAARKS